MALWMVRAGRHGEHELRFLEDSRVYLTWLGLRFRLDQVGSKADLRAALAREYPGYSSGQLSNHLGQIWAFTHEMKAGDWVATPSKLKPAVHLGEITGGYEYAPGGEERYLHSLPVRWIQKDIPRTSIDQDLLFSLGAIMTICRIERNDAERRLRALAASPPTGSSRSFPGSKDDDEDESESIDLERLARDDLAKLIGRRFAGHGLARLVDAILRAQGYTTHLSPPGADKGVDILAGAGPLGFGRPRICVQVKSGDSPTDTPTLNQLIGAMQNVQADQGLFVSWAGYKSSVDRERPTQFFRVRLWNQDNLIDELLAHYDKLDEDVRADLPLKRIWVSAEANDSEE